MNLFDKFPKDQFGLPIVEGKIFEELSSSASSDYLSKELAAFILENKPKFPIRIITLKDARGSFARLLHQRNIEMVCRGENSVYAKHEYPFINWIETIQLGHGANDASNYFHQEERWSTNGWGLPSPIKQWETGEHLQETLTALFRMNNKAINGSEIRGAFRLGSYVATQFKPSAAKFIYSHFDDGVTVDFSAGWGDRLVGFYCSPMETYIGCDPNRNAFLKYAEQCEFYESLLGNKHPHIISDEHYFECIGKKRVVLFHSAAEDLQWNNVLFDVRDDVRLIFTSPPYWSTERYAEGTQYEGWQSWKRYDSRDGWMSDFLLGVLDRILSVLPDSVNVCLNIIDPEIKGKRYLVCETLVESIGKTIPFSGAIGMRMKQRPKKTLDHMADYYVEPIFCFGDTIARKRAEDYHKQLALM